MTKKVVKIVVVLVSILMIVAISGSVFATGLNISAFDDGKDESGAADSVTRIIGAIINITQIVGTGVAIVMLIVLAIKYISAAPADKAEIKKHAIVYVVGAIVLFAATGILEIVQKFSENVQSSGE